MRVGFRSASCGALLCALLPACTSYTFAKDVKLVAFDHDVSQGRGVGPVRGESCQETVLGIPTDEPPTLDKAMADAREQHQLRYLNDVSTGYDGFDAIVFARRCIVVKGAGFQ
jgi:hypothetical protein